MKVVEINEGTRLPLGLVISMLGSVVGVVFWLTTMYADLASAKEQVKELKVEIKVLNRIDKRLSNIEGRLGIQSAPEGN